MKIWERRLMKDFQVAPVEVQETSEDLSEVPHVGENPLDRFRRIGKLVAAQSTTVKWSEVIRCATIEANSQIGRCKNRESFKNQQNLLKAMDQAKKLIDRSPMPQSPAHSETYSIVNQTNETLLKLLQNISEEINNEISPSNTLQVKTPKARSVTPLHSLNVQLQSVINSRNPSPYSTKEKSRATSPRPPAINLKKPDVSKDERIMSPPPKAESVEAPKSPRGSISKASTPNPRPKSPSKFELSKSPLSRPPASILKNRSPTPDSSKSLDDVKAGGDDGNKVITESVQQSKPAAIRSMPSIEISSERDTPTQCPPQSPTLIDLHCASNEISPLPQVSESPIKVAKRKAPAPNAADQSQHDISISRPVAAKSTSTQGMIPPPPSRNEEVKAPLQVPTLSTTPATPLPTQKQVTENIPILESPIQTSSQIFSSTEALVKPNESAASCLRPVQKIEDVKTIKRQMKTGWL